MLKDACIIKSQRIYLLSCHISIEKLSSNEYWALSMKCVLSRLHKKSIVGVAVYKIKISLECKLFS